MTPRKSKRSQVKEPPTPREYDDLVDRGVGFLARFQRFTYDFIGVFLLAFALITLIALYLPQLSGGTLITFWRNSSGTPLAMEPSWW